MIGGEWFAWAQDETWAGCLNVCLEPSCRDQGRFAAQLQMEDCPRLIAVRWAARGIRGDSGWS